MSAIDFTNSYMTFFGKNNGNIARIQIDAACTLTDELTGSSHVFYLIAPCRSERMYLDTSLFQMPNYEFCGIWSDRELMIIRTAWISDRDNREYGENRVRFDDVHLDIRTFEHAQTLQDDGEIVRATLDNRPLIARTELRDVARHVRAVLEYPVKTMNVLRNPPRFQVDTGPLILPDFASSAEHAIERFEVAHVVYNGFEKAEFVIRAPVPIPAGDNPIAHTTDYSVIQIVPARNQILGVIG